MTQAGTPRRRAPVTDPGRRCTCTVAGSTTAYWEYGDPALPVLVAVHGLRGTHHGLLPIVSRLREHRTVVPDLPGFGESGPLPGRRHDLATYAVWLREFLGALGHREPVLLGHSFGSVVAAAVVAHGAPVRALVLLSPITEPSRHPVRRAGTALAVPAHRAAAALPRQIGSMLLHNEIVTRWTGAALTAGRDRRLRRWIDREHRRHFGSFADPGLLCEAFESASVEHVGTYAARITSPTLLLAAEHDLLAPLADQHTLSGRFPAARLEVLHGSGHLAHYEVPGAVARAVEGALAQPAS